MVTPSRTAPTRTTRKPPEPKPEVVEDAPTFHFSIKQAMAEREEAQAEEPVEPYTTEGLNGETIVFKNPGDIGWQVASSVSLRDPFLAVQTMLDEENYELFIQQGDFPVEILNDVIERWMAHHGIVAPGN